MWLRSLFEKIVEIFFPLSLRFSLSLESLGSHHFGTTRNFSSEEKSIKFDWKIRKNRQKCYSKTRLRLIRRSTSWVNGRARPEDVRLLRLPESETKRKKFMWRNRKFCKVLVKTTKYHKVFELQCSWKFRSKATSGSDSFHIRVSRRLRPAFASSFFSPFHRANVERAKQSEIVIRSVLDCVKVSKA